MKKIGIITWYWGNYGSILQAYALQQYLLEAGYDCEVVRHHVNGDLLTQAKYRLTHESLLSNLASIKDKATGVIWSRTEKDERAKRARVFEEFVEKNVRLSPRAYNNSDYAECLDYDAYICGSDQIWNPSFTFLSSFYWLGFVPQGKDAIAYAPSLGAVKFKESDRKLIKSYLSKFKAVSTREENSGAILRQIAPDIKTQHVSDPTFLPGTQFWKDKLKPVNSGKKYLFAYLVKGDDKQRKYIESIAGENNLELITYPYLENHKITDYEKTWGDTRCFCDDPFDFLTKIYNAEIIVTDSFHCTVFSLQFHKDFYTLKKRGDKTNQFNRLKQLLDKCGMQKRILSEEDFFVRVSTDFAESDKAIKSLRDDSRDYLSRALNN